MDKVDVAIVGAGAVGLAVALELSKVYQDILVIEKNPSFGQETSSRNSEVVHAGLYYPQSSLKAKTCIEGRHLIYEFCLKNNIACKKIGKCIVAIDDSEAEGLKKLFQRGLENGVEGLRLISRNELKKIEPYVEAREAIYSPCTGIIDSHGFMKSLVRQFGDSGGQIAYNTELTGIDKVKGGFEAAVKDKGGEVFKFFSRILVNSAGLNADKVSAIAGLAKQEYKLKYCKGDYFRVHPAKAKFIKGLVYPVPKEERAGLGIHATVDLAGSLRLGPDDEYIGKLFYDIDAAKSAVFYESALCSFRYFSLSKPIFSFMV